MSKNKVRSTPMSIESMKKSIISHLDKSDAIVQTLYEVLLLESYGHKVEIRVRESDFIKECRRKDKLGRVEKREKLAKDNRR